MLCPGAYHGVRTLSGPRNRRRAESGLSAELEDSTRTTSVSLTEGKRKLRDLKLEYNMLYPAQLSVIVAGKTLVTDPQKLQQLIIKRLAKRQRRSPNRDLRSRRND
ncbi:hypothetical protein NDU88_004597 [Pleurodeles waltl]|uniref:Uncharacterized protein n=1 Tax=Pleurodeles waltl TaxID=8319 RepID=A0AAV7PG96_PLEWA|nr:hypothetical protein NDU88_004597 [Pleurodeles waltl]